jgi:hypothetical protein
MFGGYARSAETHVSLHFSVTASGNGKSNSQKVDPAQSLLY